MTKKHRLEDLGRLYVMLKAITEDEIFDYTNSKHCYEDWVKRNHDAMEFEDHPKGLDFIFRKVRWLHDKLHECQYLAAGFDDDE